MSTVTAIAGDLPAPAKPVNPRLGLYNSAALATLFALLGHTWLGFEQSVAQMLVALATGYSTALLLEYVDARANDRPVLWRGGWKELLLFLLPSHMTSITISFLIYVSDRLDAMMFAVALAISSKYLFKVQLWGRKRHFMNPSNFGIAASFIIFPWINLIPYEYTTNTTGWLDVVVPLVVVGLGTRLNVFFTKRVPMILAWLVTFVLQAVVRTTVFDLSLLSALMPMTGFAFLLFTMYMFTDPMTSPQSTKGQVAFGVALGLAYALVMRIHVVFGLFFAVTLCTAGRGLLIALDNQLVSRGGERRFAWIY